MPYQVLVSMEMRMPATLVPTICLTAGSLYSLRNYSLRNCSTAPALSDPKLSTPILPTNHIYPKIVYNLIN